MERSKKKVIGWVLVVCGLVGVLTGSWWVWAVMATYVAGLVWWAKVALLLGGPAAAVGAAVAWNEPRQGAAAALGAAAFLWWLLVWVVCLRIIGFEWRGGDEPRAALLAVRSILG